MIGTIVRLILFARYPVAATAKTRLIPAVGDIGAAKVHKILAEMTAITLSRAAQKNDARFILAYTGGEASDFAQWLGDNINYMAQPCGDLTDRMLAFLHPAPVIFFGSDTPDLTEQHVNEALRAMQSHDVVIGPAMDGGYYLIGMRDPHEALLRDMPWSSDQVLPLTLSRCKAAGLSVHMLETLSDCDRPEDLARWPWIMDAIGGISL